jgi:site-specific DNA recombinase
LKNGKGRIYFRSEDAKTANFSDELSDKMKRSAYNKALRGEVHSKIHACFGYDYDPATMKLVPNEVQAPFVEMAFKLFLAKYSQAEVRRQLSTKGARSRSGRKLTAQTVKELLGQRKYVGELSAINPDTGIREAVPGCHPALITQDVFNRAQRLLQGKSEPQITAPKGADEKFPLKRSVLCVCGGKLTAGESTNGKTKKKYALYDCRSCRKSVNAAKLHYDFFLYLGNFEMNPAYFEAFKATMTEVWERVTEDARNEASRLKGEITSLTANLEPIAAKIASTTNPKVEQLCFVQYESLEKTIADKTAELNALQAESVDIADVLYLAESITSNTSSTWLNGSSINQIALQSILFPNGVSYDRETATFQEVRTPGSVSLFNTLGAIKEGKTSDKSVWRPQGDSNPCYRRERAVS